MLYKECFEKEIRYEKIMPILTAILNFAPAFAFAGGGQNQNGNDGAKGQGFTHQQK